MKNNWLGFSENRKSKDNLIEKKQKYTMNKVEKIMLKKIQNINIFYSNKLYRVIID